MSDELSDRCIVHRVGPYDVQENGIVRDTRNCGVIVGRLEDIENPFEALKRNLGDDEGYAWGWHCNVAMAAQDEGVDHATANKAANRFMQTCFGIDTKEPSTNS